MVGGVNNNNQGGSKSPIPLILGILAIVSLIIYFFYQDRIDKKIDGWKGDFYRAMGEKPKQEPEKTKTIDLSENDDSQIEYPKVQDIEDPFPQSAEVEQLLSQYVAVTTENIQPNTDNIPVKPKQAVTTKEDISVAKDKDTGKTNSPKLSLFTGDNGKRGIKDESTGNIVIEPQYDDIEPLDGKRFSTYFVVEKARKRGVIDNNNRIVIPLVYDMISDVSYGKFRMVRISAGYNSKHGLILISNAKYALPAEYQTIQIIDASLIQVKKDGLFGCVNDRNEVVIPLKYNYYGSVTRGKNRSEILIDFRDDNDNRVRYNVNGKIVPV